MTNIYEVHIRQGILIIDDPQRRCYNGCFYKSLIEWSDWKHWMDYPSEDHAKHAARIFKRDMQQLKVIKKEHT